MIMDFVIRLLTAGILGAIIGLEREYRAKEAGYRTHFLVSLGSALIMIISQHGFGEVLGETGVGLDPSRIAAQVVTGIGFIGAGTIILNKQIVRGLTTAAGIWATSGIGLCIGAGMYTLGFSATALTLIGLELLSRVFKNFGLRSFAIEFSTRSRSLLNDIPTAFAGRDFIIISYQMNEKRYDGETVYSISMVIKSKRREEEADIIAYLNSFEEITIHNVE
mgnify:CR=1 FL=1